MKDRIPFHDQFLTCRRDGTVRPSTPEESAAELRMSMVNWWCHRFGRICTACACERYRVERFEEAR